MVEQLCVKNFLKVPKEQPLQGKIKAPLLQGEPVANRVPHYCLLQLLL